MLPNLQSSVTINSALSEGLCLSCTSVNSRHHEMSYEHNLNLFYFFLIPNVGYISSFYAPRITG